MTTTEWLGDPSDRMVVPLSLAARYEIALAELAYELWLTRFSPAAQRVVRAIDDRALGIFGRWVLFGKDPA